MLVRRYTETEIDVYWTDGSALVDGFLGYAFTVCPRDGVTTSYGDRQALFSGLEPGRLYKVEVTVRGTTNVTYDIMQRTSRWHPLRNL